VLSLFSPFCWAQGLPDAPVPKVTSEVIVSELIVVEPLERVGAIASARRAHEAAARYIASMRRQHPEYEQMMAEAELLRFDLDDLDETDPAQSSGRFPLPRVSDRQNRSQTQGKAQRPR
jgi:hypothetical protein